MSWVLAPVSALPHIIHSEVPSFHYSPHWLFPDALPLTALIPESCWPIIMAMMEMSCHRKPLKVHRLSTENCPSSLSERSSWRISSISSSTSSQPLSFCRASWKRKVSYGLQRALLLQDRTICKPWAEVLPRWEGGDSHMQRKVQRCRNSTCQ